MLRILLLPCCARHMPTMNLACDDTALLQYALTNQMMVANLLADQICDSIVLRLSNSTVLALCQSQTFQLNTTWIEDGNYPCSLGLS